MLYINQLKYRHIPYMHDLDNGGAPPERRNVATSGCGLCCLAMVVNHLTEKELPLEEVVRLSEANGANRTAGTKMRILGPIVSELYGLQLDTSSDPKEMIKHLQSGGEVIVVVQRKGRPVGLFTQRGHYMVIVSTDGNEVCILDPSYEKGKFDIEGRRGKVRIEEPFVYCSIDTLMEEIPETTPAFYMFKRK